VTAPHFGDPACLLGVALAEVSPEVMRSLLQTVGATGLDDHIEQFATDPSIRRGRSRSWPLSRWR
jgi:hypothetical protein